MSQHGNLFDGQPSPSTGEVFDELLRCRNLRVERITSSAEPDTGWYDQRQDEWVVLLTGDARIDLDGDILDLSAGDYLFIPAHCRHRVLQTSADPRCTWLAVHLDP